MVLLFLVPASALVAVLLVVSLPAWQVHPLNPPQFLFDLGFAIVLAGVGAGWKLSFSPVGRRRVWGVLVALAALIGIVGAVIAVLHLLLGMEAGTWVGYALLAPGSLLIGTCFAARGQCSP